MAKEQLLSQINYFIELGNKTIRTEYGDYPKWVDSQLFAKLKSGSLSFIQNVFGSKHPYFTNFELSVSRTYLSDTKHALGILESIKVEIENDWHLSLKGLVAEEIFSDQIDLAKYFLDEGYKNPSAVMAGCVLEEHLRQLCESNNIDINSEKNEKLSPKKANLLNAELAKEGVYGKLDSKNVLSWLDIRNSSAHGKFEEFNAEQVKNMISGITEFLSRTKLS